MSDPSSGKKILTLVKNRVERFFSDFMLFLKDVLILFKQNFKEVMLFILICSAFTMTATSALKAVLVDVMMDAAGVTYIVPVNLQNVFLSPASILMISHLCLFLRSQDFCMHFQWERSAVTQISRACSMQVYAHAKKH